MPKTQSERRRLKGLTVNLFASDATLGWNVIRQVSAALALEQIARKKWREIWYESGELAGVQALRPEQRKTLNQVLLERLIAVTITNPELRRNAGLYGRSSTIGMPEWRRLQRAGKRAFVGEQLRPVILQPEDAIERAQEKVRLWPFPASVMRNARGDAVTDEKGEPVFRDRAVRVYPAPPRENPTKRAVGQPAAARPNSGRRTK